MLDENQINKLRKMREKGLTVKETANALGISESSVKKYTSDDYERENEFDEKAGNSLTKQFDLEGYDFQDEIVPLIYKLKGQSNEIGVDLYDYLKDIANTMNKFLRITNKPEWFYYCFCELAKNYSLITDHIDATKFMEAIDNFYNRELNMEESEVFLTEIETKTESLIKNAKEEYKYYQEKTNELKKEIESLSLIQESVKDLNKNEAKAEKLLKNTKEEYKQWQERIDEAQESLEKITLAQTIIIKKTMENPDKNNEIMRLLKEKIYC